MFIDFDDLTEESRKKLLEYARDNGISEEDVIEEFNEEAGDSANVLDFFDSDDFLEQMLRDDSILLEDYLSFVSTKIQRNLFRRYSGRIALKKEDDDEIKALIDISKDDLEEG